MEYKVEKLISGKWCYEGQGNLEYVNRIIGHLSCRSIPSKITEIKSKNSIILNILNTCLELKEYGVDAFFYYSPSVNWVEVDIYLDGWGEEEEGTRFRADTTISESNKYYLSTKELEENLVRILSEVKNEK